MNSVSQWKISLKPLSEFRGPFLFSLFLFWPCCGIHGYRLSPEVHLARDLGEREDDHATQGKRKTRRSTTRSWKIAYGEVLL